MEADILNGNESGRQMEYLFNRMDAGKENRQSYDGHMGIPFLEAFNMHKGSTGKTKYHGSEGFVESLNTKRFR